MVNVPIRPSMLRWSMDQAGYGIERLAREVQVPVQTVDDWLHARSEPNKTQAASISKRLGRSIAFFFRESPPEVADDARAMFRSATDPNAKETPEQLAAIRRARRVQKIAGWTDADNPTLPSATAGDSAADVANRFRQSLSWTLSEQRQLSKSGVYKTLRERIELLGVLTLMQNVGQASCRGFSIPDVHAPMIFVNSAYKAPTLRAFTLIHELAHLSLGHERICYSDDSPEEAWCNKVAAEFLMPSGDFARYVQMKGFARVGTADLEPIRLTANYFKTSWHAVAIRFKQLGLAGQDVVDHIASHPTLEQDDGFNPNSPPRTTPLIRIEEFGSHFPSLVFQAVAENRLSEVEAGRLLRANGNQLLEMRQLLSRAG
ncbi:ImmA/IrrE family metallo-endopeptidase [Leifsonia aquatica]|uniref:ImmA/IrrE family metallo-endopeptidase n=1 Tax=Leifsonia aquatica TaxID=144185 RepID=UPI00381D7DCF